MSRARGAAALGFAVAAAFAAHPAGAGDAEKERIRKFQFEIHPIEFRVPPGRNPFAPLLPMHAGVSREAAEWKLRIVTLKLTSVIAGRRKVAIFKEANGPTYPYILVDGVLVGPGHKPVPGVEGSIEPGERRGSYVVTLRQGAESIEFTQTDNEEDNRAAARAAAGTAEANGRGQDQGGMK